MTVQRTVIGRDEVAGPKGRGIGVSRYGAIPLPPPPAHAAMRGGSSSNS
jgi:hypothetical protein